MAYPETPIWIELARLGRDYALSGARSLLPQKALAEIRRQCLFMGAPRNGHSLVGAMLDAHRDVVMAHELGVPKYLAAHFSLRQIHLLLIANSRHHAARGRKHIDYSHAIRGQWQGRFEHLQVIGDKHGEGFLLSVQARPWLAQALIKLMHPLYFIHVIRNPFDAIASVVTSTKRGQSLERSVTYVEQLYETLSQVQAGLAPGHLHEIRFEEFRCHPQQELGKVCRFLGVEPSPDYLDACSSIVLDHLEDHRGRVEWDDPCRKRVEALIQKHPFLSGYVFDN